MQQLVECRTGTCSFGYGPMESIWLGRDKRSRTQSTHKGYSCTTNIAIMKLNLAESLQGVANMGAVENAEDAPQDIEFSYQNVTPLDTYMGRAPTPTAKPTPDLFPLDKTFPGSMPVVLMITQAWYQNGKGTHGHLMSAIVHRESHPHYLEVFNSNADGSYGIAAILSAALSMPYVDYSARLQKWEEKYADPRYGIEKYDTFCQTWACAWPYWRLAYNIDPIVLRNTLLEMGGQKRTELIMKFNADLLYGRPLPLPEGLYMKRQTRLRLQNK